LWLGTEAPTPEVNAKLEWHIQSVVLSRHARLASTQIVDGVTRGLNKLKYLVNPGLARVTTLGCNARIQSKPDEAEKHGLENGCVLGVERAIDEYIPVKT